MTQIFYNEYIQKIILLERRVGAKTGYHFLEPFSLDSKDIISIQKAAKQIAEFVGLRGFTFIVATTEKERNVGGDIDLEHNSKEVFIEVSKSILGFDDAVLAILAHEITHKYLHVNSISVGLGPAHTYENEILTDVAAVFLGLGKLILNGCEVKNFRHEYTIEGTKNITETQKCGYLNRNQIAFVFCLICAMRKIPLEKYEKGLSPEAKQALRTCRINYQIFFNNRFHKVDIKEELSEKLNSDIENIQSKLFDIDKSILYLQYASINITENFLQEKHKKIVGLLSELQDTTKDNEHDPCLKFLNALTLDQKISKRRLEIEDYSLEAEEYYKNISKLVEFTQNLGAPFLQPDDNMFNIVICRNDGTKIKLPKNKGRMIVRCPQCQYEFIANTTNITSRDTQKENLTKRNSFLLKRIFRWLSRTRRDVF